jgi:hypothetical protein
MTATETGAQSRIVLPTAHSAMCSESAAKDRLQVKVSLSRVFEMSAAFSFRAARETSLPRPDNTGLIQAKAQPVVFSEFSFCSKLAGQRSAIRHASRPAAIWLNCGHCTT